MPMIFLSLLVLLSSYDKIQVKRQAPASICVIGKPRLEDWVPTLRFDAHAENNCFPDYAIPETNGKCSKLNPSAPVYYEERHCSNDSFKISYWWFYGWQKSCFFIFGQHDNDWENVILQFSKSGNTYCLESVRFYQHSGYYTRKLGKFEIEDNRRVIVYVGKNSHGNYHTSCRYKGCCVWEADHCMGGCGYWDDFRNPSGNSYSFTSRNLLFVDSQSVRKKERRTTEYCTDAPCRGSSTRGLATSGCWQNDS